MTIDVNAVLEIVIKILAAGVITLVGMLLPKIKQYLSEKFGQDSIDKLNNLVSIFVAAAEQLLKEDDPTGEKRKAYVVDQLKALGYEVTEAINGYIESAVYNLNKNK
jgi:hypothetical protein